MDVHKCSLDNLQSANWKAIAYNTISQSGKEQLGNCGIHIILNEWHRCVSVLFEQRFL